MRKFSAILLISLFAFSQYARQLNYIECTISNSFKADAFKCDCDKKAGLIKQDNSQSSFPRSHTHFHPDEFFSGSSGINIGTSFIPLKAKPNHLVNQDESEGNYPQPWQPPNS